MEARIYSLRQYLITELRPYYGINDKGHQEGHFDEVFLTGQLIRDKLGLPYRDELLMVTAYVHDIFSSKDRKNHHNRSGDFVRDKVSDLITMVLTGEELWLCEFACREHRASYKGSFSSKFSELFNSADLERPKGAEAVLSRAMNYRIGKGETDVEACLRDSISHLEEKFGSRGYITYPDMYMEVFGKEIKQQIRDVDELVKSYKEKGVDLKFEGHNLEKEGVIDLEFTLRI